MKILFCARTFAAIFCFLLFISCKKEIQKQNSEELQQTNLSLVKEIQLWLEQRKSETIKENNKNKIQSLLDNLQFSQIRVEDFKNEEKFIVVPISKSLITINNKNKRPDNYLLLTLDKYNNIRKGNIVQYIPKIKKNSSLGLNTFTYIFNNEPVSEDGSFTFLSITDDLLFELVFKNGKANTYSILNQKKNSSVSGKIDSGNNIQNCFLVYWVTYYEDGSSTWEFLYSYCDDQCQTTREISGKGFSLNCGGGGGDNPEYEFEVARLSPQWDVYVFNSGSGEKVYSYETFRGKRNLSEPHGGHFIYGAHQGDGCNKAEGVWGATGWTVNFSGSSSSARVWGVWSYNGVNLQIEGFKSWSFDQIFP